MEQNHEGALSRLHREASQSQPRVARTLADIAFGTGQTPLPKPLSAVEGAMSKLDELTEDLGTAIANISDRLQPVLTPSSKGAGENGSMHAETSLPSPLVERINRQSARIRATLAALNDLERRLAL